MIQRLILVHLAVCLAPLVSTCVANEQQRPNILFLFSDDHAVPQHFGVRTHAHKLMYFPGTDEWNLFDLVRDPQEMRSVHDEPDYRKVRSDLTAEFNRLHKHYDAPPTDPR